MHKKSYIYDTMKVLTKIFLVRNFVRKMPKTVINIAFNLNDAF